jgi:hypothetical protein
LTRGSEDLAREGIGRAIYRLKKAGHDERGHHCRYRVVLEGTINSLRAYLKKMDKAARDAEEESDDR